MGLAGPVVGLEGLPLEGYCTLGAPLFSVLGGTLFIDFCLFDIKAPPLIRFSRYDIAVACNK